MKCLNCGNEFEGAFCPECGQSAKVRKLTMATLFEGLMRALFSFDKGIWRTLGHLFSKPGTMISDYIHGKRASYINPFSLLVILTTIFVIEAHLLGGVKKERSGFSLFPGVHLDDSTTVSASLSDNAENGTYQFDDNLLMNRYNKVKDFVKQSQIINDIYDWTKGNKLFYTIISIPVLALSTRASFRKRRRKKKAEDADETIVYNYAECLCAMSFFACQLLCVSIVTMPLHPSSAKVDGFTDVGGLVMIGILAWDFIQMYQIRKRKAAFKATEVVMINYTILVLIALLVIAVIWGVSGLL